VKQPEAFGFTALALVIAGVTGVLAAFETSLARIPVQRTGAANG